MGALIICEELGRGAFGRVYRAQDRRIGREVALKVVRLEQDPSVSATVSREIRVLGQLNHPNIVTLHRIHERGDNQTMLEMEYVDGSDLQEQIELHGRLAEEEAMRVADSVLAALEAAHGRDVIHRDVKPANILISRGGEVKLGDFGLGRQLGEASLSASAEGGLVGTPHYMAPELLEGRAALPASDLWSVGVVVSYMTTGELPFNADSLPALFQRILGSEPELVSGGSHQRTGALVRACLQKDPAKRPKSATEARRLLSAGPAVPEWVPPTPNALTEGSPLRGRDDELAAIEQSMRRAREGASTALHLEGPPGVGVSALLQEACARATQAGGLGLYQAITRFDGLHHGLAAHAQGVHPASNAQDPATTCWQLAGHLEAARAKGPVVVAIDDLQEGNADDAGFLQELWRRVSNLGVVLVTGRHPWGDGGGRTSGLELPRIADAQSLSVSDLQRASTLEVLRDHWTGRFIEPSVGLTLVDRSGGNPRMLLELAREADECGRVEVSAHHVKAGESWGDSQYPAHFEDLIRHRVSKLPGELRDILEVTSIDARGVPGGWIAEILGLQLLETLRRLQTLSRANGWIEAEGEDYRIARTTTRQLIHDGLTPEYKSLLHSLAADRLAEHGETSDDDRIARHLATAGRVEEARRIAAAVVSSARRSGDPLRTIAFAEATSLLSDSLSGAELSSFHDALLCLSSCLLDLGEHDRAASLLAALETVARENPSYEWGHKVDVAKAAHQQWTVGLDAVDPEPLRAAVATLEDSPSRRDALYTLGIWERNQGNAQAAETHLRELASSARSAGDELSLGRALLALGGVERSMRRFECAAENYQEARLVFQAEHHDANAAVSLVNQGIALMGAGDPRQTCDIVDSAIPVLEQFGMRTLSLQARVVLAHAQYAAGDRAAAQDEISAVLGVEQGSSQGGAFPGALALGAHLAASAGRHEEAAELADRWEARLRSTTRRGQEVTYRLSRALFACWDPRADDSYLHAAASMFTLDGCPTTVRVEAVTLLAELGLYGSPLPLDLGRRIGLEELPAELIADCEALVALARGLDACSQAERESAADAMGKVLVGARHAEHRIYEAILRRTGLDDDDACSIDMAVGLGHTALRELAQAATRSGSH